MIHAALLAAALAGATPAPAAPGLYFEQTTRLRQQDGTATPGVRSRVWCAGPRLRLEAADAPGPALVLRLDEGRALRLDPESRVATELDVVRLRARSHADAAVAAGLIGGPGERLHTTPLAARRTVAGHPCRGFRIASSGVAIEAWVAEDLTLRADPFADFLEWSGAAQALPDLVAAIRALPGFPLETRMRVSVLGTPQETVSTITVIRMQAVAAERFEIPRGFRLVKEPPPAPEPPEEESR
jgi:hypothetical protein